MASAPPLAIFGAFGPPTRYARLPRDASADRRAERLRKWKEASVTNRRAKRDARVAEGLCGECGRNACADGRRSCEPCLKVKRKEKRDG